MADEPVRVLTVTAHPDDTEFGFGGTIARWADEGRLIWYCIGTNGDKGTSDRSLTPPQLAAIREKEQRAGSARHCHHYEPVPGEPLCSAPGPSYCGPGCHRCGLPFCTRPSTLPGTSRRGA